MNQTLVDLFQRQITYVRFSVTDRCNFRCVYCMPERMRFVPRAQILSLEELVTLARVFTSLGVSKIRLTGGEPLLRANIVWLCRQISALPGLDELVITTNGSCLSRMAQALKDAGVKRLNISLDTLHPEKFRDLTRRDQVKAVLAGIEAARKAGFERIKLNVVALKAYNHSQLPELLDYALERGLDISFIEEMPLGEIDSHDRDHAYYSSDEILSDLSAHHTLVESADNSNGPARYYRICQNGEPLPTRVGFISPHSHNFCATCNRVRVTAEGRLLLCLGQENSVDLRRILRTWPEQPERVREAIVEAVRQKPEKHEFMHGTPVKIMRYMNHTGG